MSTHECHTVEEGIAHADAYLDSVRLPNYSDVLDLLEKMMNNPRNTLEENDEIRGLLYGAGR